MEASIRNYIKQNFKGSTSNEVLNSINEAVSLKDEISLPGLGVLFEIFWENCDNDSKNNIINTISNKLK